MKNALKRFWRSAPKPESVPHHPVRAEILVVEDNIDEADYLCGLLRLQSAIVSRAGNIAGALELLNGPVRYQIAFVDLGLPDGSGVELVRYIKQNRRMSHVIVVTGSLDKIQLIVEYGYVGLIGKPYSTATIRQVLHLHRLPCSD